MIASYPQKSTGPSFADAVTHFESQFLSKTCSEVPSCLILIAWPPGIAKNRYLEIVMTSSILESDGMEDDLKALDLKMEVPVGIGRFFLKPLHLQIEPVSRVEIRHFFDAVRSTLMFWMYGRRRSVSYAFEKYGLFDKQGLEVLRPVLEVLQPVFEAHYNHQSTELN